MDVVPLIPALLADNVIREVFFVVCLIFPVFERGGGGDWRSCASCSLKLGFNGYSLLSVVFFVTQLFFLKKPQTFYSLTGTRQSY